MGRSVWRTGGSGRIQFDPREPLGVSVLIIHGFIADSSASSWWISQCQSWTDTKRLELYVELNLNVVIQVNHHPRQHLPLLPLFPTPTVQWPRFLISHPEPRSLLWLVWRLRKINAKHLVVGWMGTLSSRFHWGHWTRFSNGLDSTRLFPLSCSPFSYLDYRLSTYLSTVFLRRYPLLEEHIPIPTNIQETIEQHHRYDCTNA